MPKIADCWMSDCGNLIYPPGKYGCRICKITGRRMKEDESCPINMIPRNTWRADDP